MGWDDGIIHGCPHASTLALPIFTLYLILILHCILSYPLRFPSQAVKHILWVCFSDRRIKLSFIPSFTHSLQVIHSAKRVHNETIKISQPLKASKMECLFYKDDLPLMPIYHHAMMVIITSTSSSNLEQYGQFQVYP